MQNLKEKFSRELARRETMAFIAKEFVYRAVIERYEQPGWITIGGTASGKKKHVGGTPVKVDGSGRITAGPPNLENRNLASGNAISISMNLPTMQAASRLKRRGR